MPRLSRLILLVAGAALFGCAAPPDSWTLSGPYEEGEMSLEVTPDEGDEGFVLDWSLGEGVVFWRLTREGAATWSLRWFALEADSDRELDPAGSLELVRREDEWSIVHDDRSAPGRSGVLHRLEADGSYRLGSP